MKKTIVLCFCCAALAFSGCYFSNTPALPSPAGFHTADSPFISSGEKVSGLATDGKKVVAVSESGNIAFSPDDGVSWRQASIAGSQGGAVFNAVTWGGGFFLAVGNEGRAAYSADGIAWQPGIIGPMSPKDILCTAAGTMGGRTVFVAAGRDGRIAHALDSPQGPWYQADLSPFGTVENMGEAVRAAAFGIVNGNGVFVAAGDNGKIAFMKDFSGKWYGARAGYNDAFRSIAFGNDRFIAVGDNGTIKINGNPLQYAWQTITKTPFDLRAFSGIAFDPVINNFVLYSRDSAVGYSEYGESWVAVSFANRFTDGISAITCTKSRIVLGCSDGTIAYSN